MAIATNLGLELATVSNFFMNARRRSMDKWGNQQEKAEFEVEQQQAIMAPSSQPSHQQQPQQQQQQQQQLPLPVISYYPDSSEMFPTANTTSNRCEELSEVKAEPVQMFN